MTEPRTEASRRLLDSVLEVRWLDADSDEFLEKYLADIERQANNGAVERVRKLLLYHGYDPIWRDMADILDEATDD